jgi:RimJ/RimL family protein N-acetyltransferase
LIGTLDRASDLDLRDEIVLRISVVRTADPSDTDVVVLERALSDGVVTVRPSTRADVSALIAGRDEAFHRFLGDGDPDPSPTGCIVVADAIIGWVDYDHDRSWLEPQEVNVGYNVFEPFRGRGYATRAVRLLMRHLASDTDWQVATLLIHPENERSLALARRAGFDRVDDLDGNPCWKQQLTAFLD